MSIFFSAFIIGLIGSFHCVGMCGGIQHLFLNMPPNNGRSIYLCFILYHLGRLLTYFIITSIFTTLPYLLNFSISENYLNIFFRSFAAMLIFFIGISQLFTFTFLNRVEGRVKKGWSFFQKRSGFLFPPKRSWQYIGIGMLWGAIPCGHIYNAAILSASTVFSMNGISFLSPFITMFCFFLATIPIFIVLSTLGFKLSNNKALKGVLGVFLICISFYTFSTIFHI